MKVFMVNESKDRYYNLSNLISEMMLTENMTQRECIDYFMKGLGCSRYAIFPMNTKGSNITEWIMQDDLKEVHDEN